MMFVDEDVEEDEEDVELESSVVNKLWFPVTYKRRIENFDDKSRIFVKKIRSYDDGKEIIENYKSGSVCIFLFDLLENPNAQGMLNYICDGVFALEGEVTDLGNGVFMAT